MSQYKTGTVNVTTNSTTVVGNGTLWLGEIEAGDIFTVVGNGAWYEVASVVSNTELTLTAQYRGVTASGAAYAVTRDFTPENGYPYPVTGDVETAGIVKRALVMIDAHLATVDGGTY
jgi:hypothetical protein